MNTEWNNSLLAAFRAKLRNWRVKIRWTRNRQGRLHFYWELGGTKFEFYAKGASQRTYAQLLWYRGEVREIAKKANA